MNEKLRAMIERHEGRKPKMYIDSLGIPTIAVGHNLRDKPLSQRAIDVIYEDDLNDAIADTARAFPWSTALDEVRRGVLIDMVFNMGPVRVSGFKKTLAALQSADWETAANEMIDSLWASQVGNRAQELAQMIRTGQYG